MDDGRIIGKTEVVKRAWDMIVEEGPADGLFANQTKSELVWPLRRPQSHSFPTTMKVYPTPNCDILGAPIGTPDHCDEWVTKKAIEKTRKLLLHLDKLEAPHHAYLLLRYCLSFSRMVFFLRAIPVDYLPRACDTFDRAVMQGLQSISAYKFDDNAIIQSSLRLSNGGLGLRNSKQHHPAAYYASFRKSRDLICGFTTSLDWNNMPDFANACMRLKETVPDFKLDDSPTQRDLSARIDLRHKDTLFNTFDVRDRARLNAVSAVVQFSQLLLRRKLKMNFS